VTAFLVSSSLTSIHGIHGLFHSTGFVVARNLLILFAVVFWLGLAFWVNRDARRRIDEPFLVFLATLLGLVPPYIGQVIYLLFRPSETIEDVRSRLLELQALEQQLARSLPSCPVCSTAVEPDYLACPVCTTMLRQGCSTCHAPLEPLWQMCPYCASALDLSQADLDTALTAETRTVALADDTIALVRSRESGIGTARCSEGAVSRPLPGPTTFAKCVPLDSEMQ
jgi:Double zinc ribbon